MHVFRWDLDKTYLDTDFGSIRGLVRSATESAQAKQAVPGAAALVRALGERSEVRIAILSGSPTQLREVLEEKLKLDGVRFEGRLGERLYRLTLRAYPSRHRAENARRNDIANTATMSSADSSNTCPSKRS